MSHVFVSYVRQDRRPVEKLCDELRQRGVRIWIDSRDIPAGAHWKLAIRKAIKEGDLFLACFSPAYFERSSTYMNEELTLAIETLRQKPTDRAWFIPVLLASCQVPEREIGAGETLNDLQFVHLYEDWDEGIQRILAVVQPVSLETPDQSVKTEHQKRIISILFVATNPQPSLSLHLDRELRDVQQQVLDSRYRDLFDFRVVMAARSGDLTRALINRKPRIVHFAGYATNKGAILLENDAGEALPLSVSELSVLFAPLKGHIECVILNMCYSEGYAKAIAKHVRYVIGIGGEISDKHAITFSSSFYQALGAGKSIPVSFQFARTAVELAGLSEGNPVLFSRDS